MKFATPLMEGRLIRRYQRFLADVEVEGRIETVHCPNPGALMGLNAPGSKVWLSRSPNPKRRLPLTLEIIEAASDDGEPTPVGINTGLPNGLVAEAITAGVIAELAGYEASRREVRYGENSRIDILLSSPSRPHAYVEVKNVHLTRKPGLAEFPDCVTERGAKHLRELSGVVREGGRAVMVFCVQRSDCAAFTLAADIDPGYAAAFRDADNAGVETLVYACHISNTEIRIERRIPVLPI
jgi:sugar fermentation stimulation protein A